ncbi:MAG: 50S ribosomal protein L4 [Armatimonas sp.]
MPTVAIKTKGGKSKGEVTLSDRVFGAERNIPLMHQAVRAELENWRQDTRNAPGRGEMLGGGRKPFKQKGTGRSRQGSIIAPHWRKGGAAHGPHPRDLGHKLNRKMGRAAIWSALSAKLADGELVVVDAFPMKEISTKEAATFLSEVNGGAKKSLVILEAGDDTVFKSLRNIEGVTIRVGRTISTRDVVDGGVIVATKAAVENLSAWGEVKEGENA